MIRISTIVTIILTTFQLNGQLSTVPNSASNLVQNVLLGPGVTVSNITYQGGSTAIGSFTANNSNLGLASGVLITTGTVLNTGDGPHGPNNVESAGVDNGTGGYGPLTGIANGPTFNASVIQFNFVPYSDTVRFKYVFASEEYLEYCEAGFNDVFAFFIAGPGIVPDGSFGNYRNMARIPGSGNIVSIDNVHAAVPAGVSVTGSFVPARNPAYYVNNAGGSTIQYDGFTVPLEAISSVQCGETYNLIIAIADVGDGVWDSGIFLEANSLTSDTPVEIDYELSVESYDDPSIMAEGCVSATFTLTRDNNIDEALTVPINLTGTATENIDYTNIPSSVTFAPGQTQIQFTFDALTDALVEGLETIILEFVLTDPCDNETPIIVQLGIQDVDPLIVNVEDVTLVCAGDEATLTAEIEGGVGPFTFEWSTNETTESITVSPSSTQNYTVTVFDECIGNNVNATGTVTIPVYPPIVLTITDDITEICPYLPTDLVVSATGGSGGYSYQWSSSQGQQLGQNALQNVVPSTTTTYFVEVTDNCGAIAQADVLYTITSPPMVVEISSEVEICPGDSVFISTTVTGGYGDYYYTWPHSGETTSGVWVNPDRTTSYMVVVSDECETFSVSAVTTVIVQKPTANFEISSNTLFDDLPITFQNLSSNAESYEWDFGDGQTSTAVHPNNTYFNPGDYLVTLIATDEKGCKDTIQKPITIIEAHYIYVPNTFTPDNGDRFNTHFSASVYGIAHLKVQIFNRWGERIYVSEDPRFRWDGTYNGVICQDGTYTYKISYIANSGFAGDLVGHINLIK